MDTNAAVFLARRETLGGSEVPLFDDKQSVFGLVITSITVAWICVILRLVTRYRIQALGWDDFLVVLFKIVSFVGNVAVLAAFENGFGQHYINVSEEDRIEFQKKYYISLNTYILSTTLTKVSLLVQYLRLFKDNPTGRRICWSFIAIISAWGLAFFIVGLAPCKPLTGFWDWTLPARCQGFGSRDSVVVGATYTTHTATNLLFDLIVLSIPAPVFLKVFKLKKQRVSYAIVFLLGVLVNVLGAIRLYGVIETRAGTFPVIDPTFLGAQSVILAALEVDLACIVASVPVFWPYFVTQNLGKIFVTQEVHVTHHHRRLSDGEGGFDADGGLDDLSRRPTSDSSLKLTTMDTSGRSDRAPYNKNDPFVTARVYPVDGNEPWSTTQVVSEGQRGFAKQQKQLEQDCAPAPAPEKQRKVPRFSDESPLTNNDSNFSLTGSGSSSGRLPTRRDHT